VDDTYKRQDGDYAVLYSNLNEELLKEFKTEPYSKEWSFSRN
jgi:hypothetical protein